MERNSHGSIWDLTVPVPTLVGVALTAIGLLSSYVGWQLGDVVFGIERKQGVLATLSPDVQQLAMQGAVALFAGIGLSLVGLVIACLPFAGRRYPRY